MKNDDLSFVDTIYAQKNKQVSGKIVLFYVLIVLFFASVITWSYFAKIDEIARGSGKVIPSEKLKIIQSLDGGMISEILVKEGEFVKKNQPLMKIDSTRFQASLQGNEQTFYHFLVTKKRLEAEARFDINKKVPKLDFSKKVLEKAGVFAKNDEKLFHSRIEKLKSTVDFYKSKHQEKKQEVKELQARTYQLKKRIKLASQETDMLRRLVQNGSRSKLDLISSQKELSQLKGDLQEAYIGIKKSKFAMEGARNQITDQVNDFHAKASDELQKVNTEIKKYESKIVSETDKLDKTMIYSPVDGIIKQIHFNTIGGVVKPAMDLLEIVPQSDVLLVEAKISPKDIAFISPKLKAIVKITAYDFSIYGGLEGKIVEISADSMIDKDDKERRSYYKVVVKTNKNYLKKDGKKLYIIPGMVTSVDIITGEKSILDFILKPILKTKQNALHER